MSLHTDWSDAKKDSKAKFKLAIKAKRDALEKQIKAGDAKAREKVLNQNLAELGIEGNSDDVDRFFRFKEDLGPTLDKLEKAAAGRKPPPKTIDEIVRDPTLSKGFAAFAKRKAMDDFWAFVTVGWKADPQKAYDTFIKNGAPFEINIDDQYLQPLRQLAAQPAELKSKGPALLARCRQAAIDTLGDDALNKFNASPECQVVCGGAELPALRKKVGDVTASYRKQIESSAGAWKGINPDFRKPLLDALTQIDQAIAKL